MKTIFNEKLEFNDEGKHVSKTFEDLVVPWFERHKDINPIELRFLVDCVVGWEVSKNYMDTVMSYYPD